MEHRSFLPRVTPSKLISIVFLMLLTLNLGACFNSSNSSGGGSDDDSDSGDTGTPAALSGGGVDGPLAFSIVTLYAVDVTLPGMRSDTPLGEGTTDSRAAINGIEKPDASGAPYLLVFTADDDTRDLTACNDDDISGTIEVTDECLAPVVGTLRTIVTAEMLNSDRPVYATLLTTMATDLAIKNADFDGDNDDNGSLNDAGDQKKWGDRNGDNAIDDGLGDGIVTIEELLSALPVAAAQVKSTVGFGLGASTDIFTTAPILDASSDTEDKQAEVAAYRSAVQALASVVNQISGVVGGASPAAVLDAMSEDLADGAIDGKVDGAVATVFEIDSDGDGVVDGNDTIGSEDAATAALQLLDQDPRSLPVPNDPQGRTVGDMTAILVDEIGDTGNETVTTQIDENTEVEMKPAEKNPDIDGDGTPNDSDAFPNDPTEDTDTDSDGLGNNADTDDDNDGVLDINDAFPLDPTENLDTDNDGLGNNEDDDDDADGVLDEEDDFPLDGSRFNASDEDNDGWPTEQDADDTDPNNPGTIFVDTDNDGIGNTSDDDDDNDGVLDVDDAFPLDSGEQKDTDNDGYGDNSDDDIDGDGRPNHTNGDNVANTDESIATENRDRFPRNSNEWADTDRDGIGNNTDTDDDNDGVSDADESLNGTDPLLRDTDGDGALDGVDAFPNNPYASFDSDGDGIPARPASVSADDENIVGLAFDNCPATSNPDQIDTDQDGLGNKCDKDDDNDGVIDLEDAFPLNPNETVDTDQDGLGNNSDLDDDNDGAPDTNDAFPLNPQEKADTDGDGIGNNVDTDDDGDGVADVDDDYPLDASRSDKNDQDQDGWTSDLDPDDTNANIPELQYSDIDGDGIADRSPNGEFLDPDADGDGVPNEEDSFPLDPTEQSDMDQDGTGDNTDTDLDGDGVENDQDLFPYNNSETIDTDNDGIGDNADPDDDNDGILDGDDANSTNPDADGDGVYDGIDNCPAVSNQNQKDTDQDGNGNLCDTDDDNDNIADDIDNCPLVANEDQADADQDATGNACDSDDDADSIIDASDNCPLIGNEDQADLDGDGIGDVCDTDVDGDGVADEVDNCPVNANKDQIDTDEDSQGNVCDADDDGDGVNDEEDAFPLDATETTDTDQDGIGDNGDNCPVAANEDQLDTDQDNLGNVCDDDDDGDTISDSQEEADGTDPLLADTDTDGVDDNLDNCPVTENAGQGDQDSDGSGDACDVDIDGDGVSNDVDVCPFDETDDCNNMSGHYFISWSSTGETYNNETQTCETVTETEGVEIVTVKQEGTALVMLGKDDEGQWQDSGNIDNQNVFTIQSDDGEFAITGTFVPDSNFEATFTESREGCVETGTATFQPGTPVAEASAVNSGLVWVEGEMNESDQGTIADVYYEYGVISDSVPEVIYAFNIQTGSFDDVSSEMVDSNRYLTDSGVIVTDDLYQVTGYVNGTETAIVQPLSGGSPSTVSSFHVDMNEVDITGVPMLALLPKAFELGLDASALFETGAKVYLATIIQQTSTYEFWCDDDWNDYVASTYNCANIVAKSYDDLNFDGDYSDPVAAVSLDEVVGTPTEFTDGTLMGAGQWMGEGNDTNGEYNINAYFITDDGSAAGANPIVKVVKHYYNSSDYWAEKVAVGELTFSTTSVGGINVLQWDINEEIAMMGELHSDELTPFIFEESTLDGTVLVRRGFRMVAGNEQLELLFNTSAKDQLLASFNFTLPEQSSDQDEDGVADNEDNCPSDSNSNQSDIDSDGVGDVCDVDADGDGVPNDLDNCPLDASDQCSGGGDTGGIAVDTDGDGINDESDNCPWVANSLQGDDCAYPGISMAGSYLITWTSSGQAWDDGSQSCVTVTDTDGVEMVSIEQIGNQVLMEGEDEDGPWLDFGTIAANGSFTLADPDGSFSLSGTYLSGSDFNVSFSETKEGCEESGTGTFMPGDAIAEDTVGSSGIVWIEGDLDENDQGQIDNVFFEYGVISSGAVETIFGYDVGTAAFVDISSAMVDAQYYLTSTGVVATDDLYQITGYASGSDTAIVKPTSAGSASDVAIFHVDLKALNIETLPMLDLLEPAFELALTPEDVFSTGAVAYLATITYQTNNYEFWCDDDWNDYVANTYSCANIVAKSYADLDSDGVTDDPVAAVSLDEVVGSVAEYTDGSLSGAGQWMGEGYDTNGEYNINAYFITDDGMAAGANPVVKVVKHYYNSSDFWADKVELTELIFSTNTVGGLAVLEWDIPASLGKMAQMDKDELLPFLFVESSLDGTALVRRGSRSEAGAVEHELMFNAVAKDQILSAFSFSAPTVDEAQAYLDALSNGVEWSGVSLGSYGFNTEVENYTDTETGSTGYMEMTILFESVSSGYLSYGFEDDAGVNNAFFQDEMFSWQINGDGALELTFSTGNLAGEVMLFALSANDLGIDNTISMVSPEGTTYTMDYMEPFVNFDPGFTPADFDITTGATYIVPEFGYGIEMVSVPSATNSAYNAVPYDGSVNELMDCDTSCTLDRVTDMGYSASDRILVLEYGDAKDLFLWDGNSQLTVFMMPTPKAVELEIGNPKTVSATYIAP